MCCGYLPTATADADAAAAWKTVVSVPIDNVLHDAEVDLEQTIEATPQRQSETEDDAETESDDVAASAADAAVADSSSKHADDCMHVTEFQ